MFVTSQRTRATHAYQRFIRRGFFLNADSHDSLLERKGVWSSVGRQGMSLGGVLSSNR
jgi:hypothetical protein